MGWSTSDGTPTAGSDYTGVSSGTLTFTAGESLTQTVTVSTLQDTQAEGDERVTVTLSGTNLPAGVSLGTSAAMGRIADDESLAVLVSAPSTVAEGNTETFTVTVARGARARRRWR